MPEIEDTAFKISTSFEDHYFETEKRKIFNAIFTRYLPLVDPSGMMEPYEAILELGYNHRSEYDEMVKSLKELSLI